MDRRRLARGVALALWSWVVLAAVLAVPMARWVPICFSDGDSCPGPASDTLLEGFVAVLTLSPGQSWAADASGWEVVAPGAGATLRLVAVAVLLAAVPVALVAVADGLLPDRWRKPGRVVAGGGVAVPAFVWLYALSLPGAPRPEASSSTLTYPDPPRFEETLSLSPTEELLATLPAAVALALPLACLGCYALLGYLDGGTVGLDADEAWLVVSVVPGSVVVVETLFDYPGFARNWVGAVSVGDAPAFAALTAALVAPMLVGVVVREAVAGDREPAAVDASLREATPSAVTATLVTGSLLVGVTAVALGPGETFFRGDSPSLRLTVFALGVVGSTAGVAAAVPGLCSVGASRTAVGHRLSSALDPFRNVPLLLWPLVRLSLVRPEPLALAVVAFGTAMAVPLTPFLFRESSRRGATLAMAAAVVTAAQYAIMNSYLSWMIGGAGDAVSALQWPTPPLVATLVVVTLPVLALLLLATRD